MMNKEEVKETIEQVGYQEFYRYYQEKDILIEQQKQEIDRLNSIISKTIKYVQNLSSKGRDCDIYEDIKQNILKELKENKQ